MKISSLVYESKLYLYEGLTPKERSSVMLWESAGRKLAEAKLTPEQIDQIFQQVQQGLTAAGGNRTLVGKGLDVASSVNKAWEDLKTKIQNSGPIKNMDAAYDSAAEKLKLATGGDQGVMKYVQKYRDFAKKHPIAQSLIYSALIAAAGVSGAGVGGAAALGLFKMVDKLLQGEKFSSAAYSGAKTGAMAYGASQLGQAIKAHNAPSADGINPTDSGVTDNMADSGGAAEYTIQKGDTLSQIAQRNGVSVQELMQANPSITDPNKIFAGNTINIPGETGSAVYAGGVGLPGGGGAVPGSIPDATNVAQSAAGKAVDAATQGAGQAVDAAKQSAYNQAVQDFIKKFAQDPNNPSAQVKMMAKNAAKAKVFGKTMGESKTSGSTKLTPTQINLIFENVSDTVLLEGFKDFIGKAANWAKTKGTNLTTKVTADKLQQAWKSAGSPTDSEKVKEVLIGAGVPENVISSVFTQMNIGNDSQVGTKSSTGGDTFSEPGSTVHKAASGREAMQQQARDRIEAEKRARNSQSSNPQLAAPSAQSSAQEVPGITSTPTAEPAATPSPAPAATPAPATKASAPTISGIDGIKKAYTMLDQAERDKLKNELEIIDDQERLASGTNESLERILKLVK